MVFDRDPFIPRAVGTKLMSIGYLGRDGIFRELYNVVVSAQSLRGNCSDDDDAVSMESHIGSVTFCNDQ